ncbi:hypothetical protein KMP13_02365 [Epibacterium ulvae]|uniref:hypothetical protein n=1 Tax=Epibacterium ulvae TaxID=1156985 RepID=UPI001BFCB9E2|nr:hypothetical protein [Epibacterium ulvae]MBT8152758.1 hypothetical protein [Epibacterium ulvae]
MKEVLETLVETRTAEVAGNWGTFGGSIAAVLAWIGSQDVAAGLGVIIGVAGLALSFWRVRFAARIERAKLTPEQRATFEQS